MFSPPILGRKPSPSSLHHSGPWSPRPSPQAHEHYSKPLLQASGAPSFRYSPPGWRDGTSGKQPPAPRTYLKARIGNQARVVAEVRCVMLHHPLGLRLAEMLVRRREAARREHYCRAFWKQQYEKGKGSELHILHSEPIRTTKGNPLPVPPFSHPSECKARSSFRSWAVREGRKQDVFHPNRSTYQHSSPPQALTKLCLNMNYLSCFKIQQSQSSLCVLW